MVLLKAKRSGQLASGLVTGLSNQHPSINWVPYLGQLNIFRPKKIFNMLLDSDQAPPHPGEQVVPNGRRVCFHQSVIRPPPPARMTLTCWESLQYFPADWRANIIVMRERTLVLLERLGANTWGTDGCQSEPSCVCSGEPSAAGLGAVYPSAPPPPWQKG